MSTFDSIQLNETAKLHDICDPSIVNLQKNESLLLRTVCIGKKYSRLQNSSKVHSDDNESFLTLKR